MIAAGQQLRSLREKLGLTMRDVEIASAAIAGKRGNDDFSLTLSRLSDIETKGIIPSIYRLYSLAVIYRCDFNELLSWYGIELADIASDLKVISPPRSHKTDALQAKTQVRIPVRMDPGFDTRRTANLGRMLVDAHKMLLEEVLQTPLAMLVEDSEAACAAQGRETPTYLDELRNRRTDLLPEGSTGPATTRHLSSVLSALSALTKAQRSATPPTA